MAQVELQELKKKLQQAEDRTKTLEEELRNSQHKWELLFQPTTSPQEERRTRLLRIRCTKKTFDAFKAFIIDGDFEIQEDGLTWLLRKYSEQVFDRGTIRISR